jgi:hypothetical protein
MNDDLKKDLIRFISSEVVFNSSAILTTSNEKNFIVGLLIEAGYKFGNRLYSGSIHGF